MNVAVTIPCKNEERYIVNCILSVLQSDYSGGRIRVLVCDGKSTDHTQELVRSIARNDNRVELLINERETTPFALNLGIKHAYDCDVHIILGAHSQMMPGYISRCVAELQKDRSVGCVGGILDTVNEDATTEIIAEAMSSRFGVGNAHFRTGAKLGYVDTVAFGAYRKEVFERVGYFDEDLTRNQDDEFNYRVIKGGFRILLIPVVSAKYFVRSSYEKLWRQYYQYGFWKVYVNKKHKAVTTLRQLVPPTFVLFIAMGLLTPFLGIVFRMLWSLVFTCYVFCAVILAVRRPGKRRTAPGAILAFFILHFSYGLGYLNGIWSFFILGQNPSSKHSTSSR